MFWTWLVVRLEPSAAAAPWRTVLAVGLAYLAADLVGGLVHWAVDTWGSPEVPILGPAMIGPFREHHRDPQDITRHDFVETNGNSALIALPLLGIALWLLPGSNGGGSFPVAAFLAALALWVVLTNQFHKWAHLPKPPRVVALLQRLRLVLPPDHHARHHARRVESHWCITTGIMNGLLDGSRLLRVLEASIARWTGAVPWRGEPVAPRSTARGAKVLPFTAKAANRAARPAELLAP